MAITDYLVDTCSYFRLSQSLAPILGSSLGKPPIRLKLIQGFAEEFSNSSRLTTKFFWATQPPHPDDRKTGTLKIHQAKDAAIRNNYKFIADEARKQKLTTGYVDMRTAAVALELDLTVVTDDQDLRKLIDEFAENNFKWISSLDLLSQLVQNAHIKIEDVDRVVSYWIFTKDTPYKNWETEYKKFFNKDIPQV